MQLHQLQPQHLRKTKKRVGRGGKRGSYSGRGLGGQKKRAGRKLQPIIREFIKRYPKLKGYRYGPTSPRPVILNIDQLEKNFANDEKINPKTLVQKNLIRKRGGRLPKVKILGQGELTKRFVIENCDVSRSAKEKIEKVGGDIIQS